jgi:hypothetical protein
VRSVSAPGVEPHQNKKAHSGEWAFLVSGAPGRIRTSDHLVRSGSVDAIFQ